MDILKDILHDIKPTEVEQKELKEMSNKIINKINKIIKENPKYSVVIGVVQVGSTARNTHLRNNYDIDIFLIFDKNTDREILEEIGLEVGKKAVEELGGKYWVEYAEHPYTSAVIGKYSLDIVPCYKIRWGEKIISAVDRTPLHNEFLKRKLEKNKLCDEIRLFKKFLKGIGIYGSDLKTKGFSGYLCELLVIYYGSFIEVLKNAKDWKIGERIILEDIYKIYNLDGDFKFRDFDAPLIVYDPVDINRNVAAALSKENFCKFIFYASMFLKNPSKEFFYNYCEHVDKKLEDREYGALLTLKIKRDKDIVDDIIYPQMEKLQKSINKIIQENEFVVLRCDIHADGEFCYLSWEFLVYELPNIRVKEGPSIFKKDRVERFIKKYDKHFIKGCRLYAYTTRKYKNVYDLFNDIVNGNLKGKISYPKYVNPENGEICKMYIKSTIKI
ncbi:CCA tRNA nucleotidyltransferase [Methanotorris formicicus]|uniref:CCA-adding enzyme n=1 Tax=Methanotorris formicicus Mc-S-70 TaxID=647171 RepID=H1KZ57_9EURY|nr:CCA tRNA nucleotidyltransferase [Methanotorris formicicus]EHP86340.1 CCA-adding enzyme [Methanotorris formicicus Mc-S-70]